MRYRLAATLLIGLLAGTFCWYYQVASAGAIGSGMGDLRWSVQIVRDLAQGQNPYDRPLSPGLVTYPMTTALIVLPFAFLPLPPEVVAGLFMGSSSALLAWGLTANQQYWRLIILLSFPCLECIRVANWPVLVLATWFLPVLIPLVAAKPNIGVPIVLEHLSWYRYIFGAFAIIGLITLLLLPTWPFAWMNTLGDYVGRPALFLLPWGLPLLALATSWRVREVRYLLWYALVPLRPHYDYLMLFAAPTTFRGMVVLVICSWLYFGSWYFQIIPNAPLGALMLLFYPLGVIVILENRAAQQAAARAKEA